MSLVKKYEVTVGPTYKKSINELVTFRKPIEGEENKYHYITQDQGWRWGKWVGLVTEEELQELKEDSENESCEPDCYEGLDMDYLDDGVWLFYEGSDGVTDEMLEAFEEAWDEDGYEGVEELGWEDWGTEIFINSGLEIEVGNEVEVEVEDEEND